MNFNKIPVAEIFGPTIQGEGPNVGIKTLFVRVVGCDFNCSWCDSKFAWKRDENTIMVTARELAGLLINKCQETKTKNVVLTGGNPCLYDFKDLVLDLHDLGISVDVETQGSKLPEWLYLVDNLVISPKAPSSGQPDVYENIAKFLYNPLKIKTNFNVAIKIPVFNKEDFKFAERYYKLIEEIVLNTSYVNMKMYLSVGNTNTNEEGYISKRILLDYKNLINKTMESGMQKVYVLPQVHTLVWGNKQGV